MAKVPAPPRPPQEAFPTERGSPCPPDMSHSSNLSGRPVAFSEDGRLPMAHRGQAVARPWRPPISSTPPARLSQIPAAFGNEALRPRVLLQPLLRPQRTALFRRPPAGKARRRAVAPSSKAPRNVSRPCLFTLSCRSFIGFDGWSLPPPRKRWRPPQKKQNAPLFPTPPTCRFPPSDFPLPPPVQGKIRGTRLSYGIFVPSPPLPPGNPLVRPCPASTPTWKASPGKRSWN